MSLQEKFQISVPAKEEAGDPWVTAQSQHINAGNPMPQDGEKFNVMPVGYDATCVRDNFSKSFGGDGDVSGGIDAKALKQGFKKREMKGTDDQYTGEHTDLFYGDAGGFVERNNYLDRE